jgi:hypothetical protein
MYGSLRNERDVFIEIRGVKLEYLVNHNGNVLLYYHVSVFGIVVAFVVVV